MGIPALCLVGFLAAQGAALEGVRLSPVPEVLYAQLPSLPPGQGVVVEEIQRESPLAQAGLRQYDILLSCDGARLRDGKHFAELLAEGKPGQSHRLDLLRAGRPFAMTYPSAAAVAPKGLLKAGGPPAVAVDAQSLDGGKLKVVFVYYSPAGKLERVTCSGSLGQIEAEVRQMGEQKRMPQRVQDLVDVALKRIRVLNSDEGP